MWCHMTSENSILDFSVAIKNFLWGQKIVLFDQIAISGYQTFGVNFNQLQVQFILTKKLNKIEISIILEKSCYLVIITHQGKI